MLKNDNVVKRCGNLYSYIYFMVRVQNASTSSHFHVFGKNPQNHYWFSEQSM